MSLTAIRKVIIPPSLSRDDISDNSGGYMRRSTPEPTPPRPASVTSWYMEALSNNTSGEDASYELTYEPLMIDNIQIFVRGLLQRMYIDYSVEGKIITFLSGPLPAGLNVYAAYFAKK